MSRFDYVKYDQEAIDLQLELKAKYEDLEKSIDKLKNGRYKSLALTDLEYSYAMCGKAIRDEQIERNGSTELQEERCDS